MVLNNWEIRERNASMKCGMRSRAKEKFNNNTNSLLYPQKKYKI